MARVVAFVPDLLFGSNVIGGLRAAGHEPTLVSRIEDLPRALSAADVLVVDLTAEATTRIEAVRPLLEAPGRLRSLAFFSHVEADVRVAAREAGFDLVVPRSRMARAMGELVTELSG
jgi:DNA-binding NarL/FixJ family response regulator